MRSIGIHSVGMKLPKIAARGIVLFVINAETGVNGTVTTVIVVRMVLHFHVSIVGNYYRFASCEIR